MKDNFYDKLEELREKQTRDSLARIETNLLAASMKIQGEGNPLERSTNRSNYRAIYSFFIIYNQLAREARGKNKVVETIAENLAQEALAYSREFHSRLS